MELDHSMDTSKEQIEGNATFTNIEGQVFYYAVA
jgi:hypothetical protein